MSNLSPNARKWWVIFAASTALAMIFVDLSALPVALPSIQRELHVSQSMLNWVVNAYLLSLATLIILGGKMGDKYGYRRVFMGGMLLFILSSILCAAAPSGEWLIAGRVLQGIGGAFMMPNSSPIFRAIVKPEEIGRTAGIYVSIASVFLLLGPSVGGLLTEYVSWRGIFWINFPLALAGILITWLIVPIDTPAKRVETFDWRGFILMTVCLVSLVYIFMEAPVQGWTSVTILSIAAIFIVSAFAFFHATKKHPYPFFDLMLFRDTHFSSSIYVLMLTQCIFMGTVFWAIFLQYSLGLSAAKAGMMMLATQAPIFLVSHAAGRLFDRYGPRLPTCIGIGCVAISMLWVAIFAWQHNFWWLFPGFLILGCGGPLINLSNMSSIISAAPAEKRGIASGIASATRHIAGCVGLAIVGSIIAGLSHYEFTNAMAHANSDIAKFSNLQLDAVLGHSVTSLAHSPQADAIYQIAKQSYTFAFSIAMMITFLLAILAFWVAQKLPKKKIS